MKRGSKGICNVSSREVCRRGVVGSSGTERDRGQVFLSVVREGIRRRKHLETDRKDLRERLIWITFQDKEFWDFRAEETAMT